MANVSLSFTIEGENQMLRRLRGISESLKDFKPEFRQTGRLLLKTFSDNFNTQGRTLGEPWARLKPSTIKQKIFLGYAGAGPLVRTGTMKKNFHSEPSSTEVRISNPTPHFGYHQSNKARSKLPRRVMMKIDEMRRQQIVGIFQRSVQLHLENRY